MPVCIGKKRTSGRTVCPVCAVILSGVRQFCKRADGSDAQVIDFITDLFYNDLSSHIMTRSEREDTMNLTLRTVRQDELAAYKKEMQRAFQLGAEAEYGETDMQILPEAGENASMLTARSLTGSITSTTSRMSLTALMLKTRRIQLRKMRFFKMLKTLIRKT